MTYPAKKIPVDEIKFTYDDYLLLPDDGKRYEIIEGELYMTPAPNLNHQDISREFFLKLHTFVSENHLGLIYFAPCDILFSMINVVQPDILFVSKQNRGIRKTQNIQGAPDLVVEITSPSTKKRDIKLKKNLYAKFGVKEYWIAFAQEEKVEVWSLENKSYTLFGSFEKNDTLASPLLAGLAIKLDEIFRTSEDYFD